MTSNKGLNQSAENSSDNNDASEEKNDSINKMGKASSSNKQDDKKSVLASPMVLTVLLALPVAAIIAYVYMPDELNRYLSFNDPTVSTETVDTSSQSNSQQSIPIAANSTAMNSNMQNNRPDWATQQRADFEKRRAEYQQRNAANYTNPNYQNKWASTPPEPPQWVKDRQAEMEKQRVAMEKQREQYMKEMAKQQAMWVNNQGYNQPAMNPHPQNPAMNNQPQMPPQQSMPYGRNQAQNPYYRQPRPYYPQAPMYNNGSYNRAYGHPGYGYR